MSLNQQPTSGIVSAQTVQEIGSGQASSDPEEKTEPLKPITYSPVKVKDVKSLAALKAKLGEEGFANVLKVNRLDRKHMRPGATLVVPNQTDDLMALSPFPKELEMARHLPKLILVSREVQAFGAYESGKLVHWGPTSTGKRATQTPAGLYSTNWKKKVTRSSVDPSWILPWAFNLDNLQGIAFHQYDLPGYPASHGCVRLLNEDAQWIFGWADTWILSAKGNSLAAYGTPVIIFGDYSFGKEAPWKRLPGNSQAANVPVKTAEQALGKHLTVVEARVQARQTMNLVVSTR
jgi:lipoprotein-anchoring transpeptidase ErfK/SrfK